MDNSWTPPLENIGSICDARSLGGGRPRREAHGPRGPEGDGDVVVVRGTAMLNYPDPLVDQADIAAVANETDLSRAVVKRVHGHLTKIQGDPPTRGQLLVYAAYVSDSLGEGGLRLYFKMPADPRRPATPRELWRLEEILEAEAARQAEVLPSPSRRRGRPKGTRTASRQQIVDAYRRLRSENGKAPTQAQLAANLDPPVGHRTLQAWLREYGLPWPIE